MSVCQTSHRHNRRSYKGAIGFEAQPVVWRTHAAGSIRTHTDITFLLQELRFFVYFMRIDC